VSCDWKERSPVCRTAWLLAVAGCGSAGDAAVLYEPWVAGPSSRQPAFLAFSSAYDGVGPAPIGALEFPKRLSDTGAFADVERLEAMSGIVPYEIQAPLWSDGASKRRWVSVPEGAAMTYSETENYGLPLGTVFIKHFELALDERFPDSRRRLETRFWVAVSDEAQYGVTYRWNDEQTDAELVIQSETEMLSIVGVDGAARTQAYFYPGPADCHRCHTEEAGFVLGGARTAQLNRRATHRLDRPPIEQLVAWSSWGLLDARLGAADLWLAPRLSAVADESASLEDRVRSYWDGNCAMCHAGTEGVVPGWDARYSTAFDDQGLATPPRSPAAGAAQLIAPGSPAGSLIYLRGDTTELGKSMPPLGRNRVDEVYVDVLGRWIASLATEPPAAAP
jgi:uncharacterized repeat protein (TIGR03806 family)